MNELNIHDLTWAVRRLPGNIRDLLKTHAGKVFLAGGSMLRVLKFYQRGYRIPLDSLGAVIARLASGVTYQSGGSMVTNEPWLAKILTGLLREVDPLIDPDHISHLPSADEEIEPA